MLTLKVAHDVRTNPDKYFGTLDKRKIASDLKKKTKVTQAAYALPEFSMMLIIS